MGDFKKENSNPDVLLFKQKSENFLQSFENTMHLQIDA